MANAQAFQSGWDLGSKLGAERRERKQALSDEEFKMQAERLADELAGNRKILSGIDQTRDPDKYKAKVADLEKNLSDLRELYHPDRHPGAVARFGHLITDKLGITDPKKRIQLVAQRQAANMAGDEQEAQSLARSTPQATNPEKLYRDNLVAAGFTGLQADLALRVKAGVEARAVEAKVPRPSAFDEGFLRYLKSNKGIDDIEDASFEDEQEYRKSLHPAPAAKPLHQSDFAAGFARYLREHHIDPSKATAEDERRYRAIIHPVRSLKQLKDEAAKRKPAKRRHTKAAHPAYGWSLDPSHQQPAPH